MDKLYHFIVSAGLIIVLDMIFGLISLHLLPVPVVLTLGVGIGKEVYDYKHGRTDYWWDLLADFIGLVIGEVLFLIWLF